MRFTQGTLQVTKELLSRWENGAQAFNAGAYWDAHEHWESGWLTLPIVHKRYVQSLIQAAAVFYLIEEGRPDPAQRLCRSALSHGASVEAAGGIPAGDPKIVVPGLRETLERKQREAEFLALGDAKNLKASIYLPDTRGPL